MNILKIACGQITSSYSVDQNLKKIELSIEKAKDEDCNIIALPEYSTYIPGINEKINFSKNDYERALQKLITFSNRYDIDVLFGTLNVNQKQKKHLNKAMYVSGGNIVMDYSKIHLFDATVSGVRYQESIQFDSGTESKVFKTNYGKFGIAICYDLRFPSLFRIMAKNNASVIFVPSAFTKSTGLLHWESLLRARAIENSVYIIAPAQVGIHDNKRETYGYSMIISPNGEILSNAEDKECVISSVIDLNLVNKLRDEIGSLHNRQNYKTPSGLKFNETE